MMCTFINNFIFAFQAYLQESSALKELIFLFSLFCMPVLAQVAPVLYYTFDTSNPYAPFAGTGNLTTGGSSITTGKAGNCMSQLEYRGPYTKLTGGNITATSAITFQFAMKGGYYFLDNRNVTLFNWGNIIVYFGSQVSNVKYNNITFTYKTSGSSSSQSTVIDMAGVDRSSLTYYMDEGWHHYAFVLDAVNANAQVWVDGALLASDAIVPGSVTQTADPKLYLNSNTAYDQFYGYLDEFAVYNAALTGAQIYKNYLDFASGNHYTTALYSGSIPSTPAQTAPLNILDYPVGYTLGGESKNIPYSAYQQILTSPVARYPAVTNLFKNFCWCAMTYVGGQYQTDISDPEAQSAAIQYELVHNYNYSLIVSANVGSTTPSFYTDTTKYQGKWVAMAKADTSIQTAAITFWSQLGTAVNVKRKDLADNFYLRDSTGAFLTTSGQVTTNPNSKTVSPSAPLSLINTDGVALKARMTSLKSALGTSTLDYVNEDDEVLPVLDSSVLAKDPWVVSDYASSGYPNYNEYLGGRQARYSIAYRDSFMSLLAANTHYTQYRIDGGDGTIPGVSFTVSYKQRRLIGSLMNGRYYSTVDFYPRYPWNYKAWSTSSRALQKIEEARYAEISLGDKSFSPFVAAGWNGNEEQNLRPGRWLGLLKLMGVWGADFFYTGYFNEASNYNPPNPPPSHPKGYAWQLLMPSYAQALIARYDTIVHTGIHLSNTLSDPTKTYPGYNLWSGDPRLFVVARRDSLQSDRYLISATIQPSSNMTGNAPLSKTAKFLLGSDTIFLEARQQGSTYELINSQNKIRQLDVWHEPYHPMRWSINYEVEAEVSDSTEAKFGTEGVVISSNKKDFTTATSYCYGDTTYYFMRVRASGVYYGWIRAKKASGSTANIGINVPQHAYTRSVAVGSSEYAWYRISTTSSVDTLKMNAYAGLTYSIRLQIPTNIYVDKMLWTFSDTLPIQVPIITANGSTSLCTGDSITLTSSVSNTYLWNTGATTRQINVKTPGYYRVTVTNSLSYSATSDSMLVTVDSCLVNLNLRAFVQGYYLGNKKMIAAAKPNNFPLLCDTFTVELHNLISPHSIFESRRSTLNTDGFGNFNFHTAVLNNSYYIVLRHRNTMETWSKNPVLFNGTSVSFDFTKP